MVFEFSIGGYFSGNFHFILKDEILYCSQTNSHSGDAEVKPIDISQDERWEKLISFLNTLTWKGKYEKPILDGTQWQLKFTDKGFKLRASGSNDYPEDFEKFLELVREVTEMDVF
jgi:hypothetical protein